MRQLDFNKTKKLLEKYKVPFSLGKIAKSSEQAVKAAKEIKFPVVLKIVSKEIIHKSDIGGVAVGLKDAEEVRNDYEILIMAVKKKLPRAKIEGVLVQRMIEGREVIIGMKRDPQFGAVLMFGLGGIFVEVLKDVSFRIAPVDKKEAEGMINEIKASKVLKGIRGEKAVKISALVEILIKVSGLAVHEKKIVEIDLNPVIVNEKSAWIVDARMMVE